MTGLVTHSISLAWPDQLEGRVHSDETQRSYTRCGLRTNPHLFLGPGVCMQSQVVLLECMLIPSTYVDT